MQVVPCSPAGHYPCGALRSKSGVHQTCFAAAGTAKPFESAGRDAAAALRAAISQAALLRKSSPDSGAGCAGSDLLSDVQDDRRSGTYRGPAVHKSFAGRERQVPRGEFSDLQIALRHRTWTGALPIYLERSVQAVMPMRAVYFTLSAYTDFHDSFACLQVCEGSGIYFPTSQTSAFSSCN